MQIAIASDHHGWKMKLSISDLLAATRPEFEIHDLGPETDADCDYPDYAYRVADGVSQGRFDRGILIGQNGIGMAIVANKFSGVRAVVVRTPFDAEFSRRHNDANILCLPEYMPQLERVLETWFATEFEGATTSHDSRHARRIQKICALERCSGIGS